LEALYDKVKKDSQDAREYIKSLTSTERIHQFALNWSKQSKMTDDDPNKDLMLFY